MTVTIDDRNKILRYWLIIEALTPQKADRENPKDRREPIYKINKKNGPMPWEFQHEHHQKPVVDNKKWIYTVQAGLYSVKKLFCDVLKKINANENETYLNELTDDTGRLYDVEVDADGQPIPDTFALSMAGWAVGLVLQHGIDALLKGEWSNLDGLPQPGDEANSYTGMPGFDRLEFALREELRERVRKLNNQGATKQWFDEFTALVVKNCELPPALFPDTFQYMVKSRLVSNGNKKQQQNVQQSTNEQRLDQSNNDVQANSTSYKPQMAEDSLINSFYISDLKRMIDDKSTSGKAFKSYFIDSTEHEQNQKVDLRSIEGEMETVQLLQPKNFPTGTWPSSYPLVRSQQFAVNALWKQLNTSKGGLFAVNGPPGTGKTTLLRDIVASVIVERAKILAKCNNPEQFFGDSVKEVGYNYPYYPVSQLDHTIVVASSNNGAVENVTLELPKQDAIDSQFLNRTSYYKEIATDLLQSSSDQATKDITAWGLITTRLGKKANRQQFIYKVLDKASENINHPQHQALMQRLLDIQNGNHSPSISWKDAVNNFNEALQNEKKLRDSIIQKTKILDDFLKDWTLMRSDIAQFKKYKQQQLEISKKIKSLENDLEQLDSKMQQKEIDLSHHKKSKPNWFAVLKSLGKDYFRWLSLKKQIEKELHDIEEEIQTLKDKIKEIKTKEDFQKGLSLVKNRINLFKEYRKKISELNNCYGDFFTLRVGSIDTTSAELRSPWAIEEWRLSRIEVFLRALELHQAFIENATKPMRANLILVKHWLSGKVLSDQALKTALETLGLVVPVISTTFASFPRMFQGFKSSSIGWLLIDEAGQATPQEAAGAIWRSNRAVVVGDPLQLEPIVALPPIIVELIGKKFDVKEDWWPHLVSVQSLADRSMKYGTKITQLDGSEVWVGAPLRVHRRCDKPMFDISNRLSYNDMMVWGRKSSTIILPNSGWIDVHYSEHQHNGSHFIHQEGEMLIKLLMAMKKNNNTFNFNDIYIVSPFRDVARNIRTMIRDPSGLLMKNSIIIPYKRIGTVHTSQGKEATVVIFVLGSSSPNQIGAREWTSSKPNLLNVAVSRAKERLYVIGDRSAWKVLKGFDIITNMLEALFLEDIDMIT